MRNIKPLTAEQRKKLQNKLNEGGKLYFLNRISIILLSDEGVIVKDLCAKYNLDRHAIYACFNRYEQEGWQGLTIRKGRGVKAILDSISDELSTHG